MSYDDLHEYGSETAVKAAGKLRQQGKPYESKVIHPLHRRPLLITFFCGSGRRRYRVLEGWSIRCYWYQYINRIKLYYRYYCMLILPRTIRHVISKKSVSDSCDDHLLDEQHNQSCIATKIQDDPRSLTRS